MKAISCAILAGGKNFRFNGKDKAFIDHNGIPLIEHTLNILKLIFDDIIIITNSPESYVDFKDVRIFSDEYKNIGPLGGIHVALKHCKNEACFVLACDMPNINIKSIKYFLDYFNTSESEILVPKKDEFAEPLFAIYSKRILNNLITFIHDAKKFKITLFLDKEDCKYIEIFDKYNCCFTNINYPSEISKILIN